MLDSLKDSSEWKNLRLQNFSKSLKMKIKNGEEKNGDFSTWPNYFIFSFFWISELCWFQIFLQSKVYSPMKWDHFSLFTILTILSLLWRAVTFDHSFDQRMIIMVVWGYKFGVFRRTNFHRKEIFQVWGYKFSVFSRTIFFCPSTHPRAQCL